jgi:hypothetical protein
MFIDCFSIFVVNVTHWLLSFVHWTVEWTNIRCDFMYHLLLSIQLTNKLSRIQRKPWASIELSEDQGVVIKIKYVWLYELTDRERENKSSKILNEYELWKIFLIIKENFFYIYGN